MEVSLQANDCTVCCAAVLLCGFSDSILDEPEAASRSPSTWFLASTPASGPYGLIYASFVLYAMDVPATARFTLFAQFHLTDKTLLYAAGMQVQLAVAARGREEAQSSRGQRAQSSCASACALPPGSKEDFGRACPAALIDIPRLRSSGQQTCCAIRLHTPGAPEPARQFPSAECPCSFFPAASLLFVVTINDAWRLWCPCGSAVPLQSWWHSQSGGKRLLRPALSEQRAILQAFHVWRTRHACCNIHTPSCFFSSP